MSSKLYDYLLDKYGLGVHDESDMDIIRDIVLEETGFKWIPVTEKLPQERIDVLVTLKNPYQVRVGFYDNEFGEWWVYGMNDLSADYVITWMPLPKPYNP